MTPDREEDRGGRQAPSVALSPEEDLRVWASTARIAQRLLASLLEGDLLTQLCALAVEEIGCDASHVFLRPDERDTFAAAAQWGEDAEVWGLARLLEIPPGALGGVLERLQKERLLLVSYSPTTVQMSAIPETSAEELEMSSRIIALARRGGPQRCLFVALTLGERVVGFQTACLRESRGGFGAAQVQLARRIAHLTSFAAAFASMREERERAGRLQSQFVANMSHELRTPLNVVMGYNALLLEGEYGPVDDVQRQVLGRIAARSRELLDLITNTLDFGRLVSGQVPFESRAVDVSLLMSEVEAETRHLRTRPSVRFSWHCEEPLPALDTDPSKLRIVLANLIGNAAKFTERGEVNVVARATSEAFQFVVSDTGAGIEPQSLASIFEPFRKGEREGGERRAGVGLGLYIVRSLVERLGGKVLVESQPGRGSRFVVQLPVSRHVEEE